MWLLFISICLSLFVCVVVIWTRGSLRVAPPPVLTGTISGSHTEPDYVSPGNSACIYMYALCVCVHVIPVLTTSCIGSYGLAVTAEQWPRWTVFYNSDEANVGTMFQCQLAWHVGLIYAVCFHHMLVLNDFLMQKVVWLNTCKTHHQSVHDFILSKRSVSLVVDLVRLSH